MILMKFDKFDIIGTNVMLAASQFFLGTLLLVSHPVCFEGI
jgi:hypothetical protein